MGKHLFASIAVLLAIVVAPSISAQKADKKKVVEDLKAAFAGETTASAKYAAYAEKAKMEGLEKIALLFEAASKAESIHAGNHQAALITFNYAYKTELKHKALYEGALKALESDKAEGLPSRYQVCTTCGNTYENEGPARCGICMTSNERFVTVE